MLRVTLRSFWEHKRRLISTILAVLLGVAFMAGTFVLSDTIRRSFDDIFADVNAELDAQVQGEVLFSSDFGDERAPLDESLLEVVADIDGVAHADPYLGLFGAGSFNRVLGADGDPIGSFGPPTLFENWVGDSPLSPFELIEGRGPEAADEIVINARAAEDGELAVGDEVTLLTQFGQLPYTLVGITTVGGEETLAGAVQVGMLLPEVQRLAGQEGLIQQVLVEAEEGLSQDEVVEAIAAEVPGDVEVLTGEQATEEVSEDVVSGFSFITIALSVFGGVALFVGAFVISNTFSILVAQRTRELALLRAVGASRRQVMTSVLLEAVIIGLVAATLGLAAGIGLAALAFGFFDLPGNLVVQPDTAISALLIGLVIALVAAIAPAVRATRVPPLAALRDVAVDRSGASRLRLGLGLLFGVVGLFLTAQAWLGDGSSDVLPTVGMGAALVVLAALTLGPVLAEPSVRIVGAWLPKLRGVTGRLAVENAARSPKRTAATAAALIIGVALVTFITVFASSAQATTEDVLDRGFRGDFVVQAEGGFTGFGGFPPTVAEAVAGVEGVDVVMPAGFGAGELTYPDGDTSEAFIGTIDPSLIGAVLEPEMTEGSLEDLTAEGIVVDVDVAEDHELELGDTITLRVPGGATAELELQAISDDEFTLGSYTVERAAYSALVPQPLDFQVFGTIDEGADLDAVLADVDAALEVTPGLEVLDREGFEGAIAASIDQVLQMVLILLLISIVIAVIGIANTLSLSIHERVRELGLLRAVGMDRGQLRSSVRWEAVLISVLGALVGLALGCGLSWAFVTALEAQGFTEFRIPPGPLVVIVLFGATLGVVASLLPARRAARLPVLDAIATE